MKDTSHLSRLTSYLITGGCGFIGVNLINHLLTNNPVTRIRVLDNLSVGTRRDLSKVCDFEEIDDSRLTSDNSRNSVQLVVGDIRDYAICESACKDMDVVVHLAANTGVALSVENPREDMETNVRGTFNMLEASRQNDVDRFIFASSGAPLGEVEPPIHEEKAPRPVSPYGASKLAGEGYCSAYYRTFGLKTVSLRFGNVYGPRSKHKNSIVAKFIKQALAGETLEIYGDGNQTRDFIYIDDLLNAIRLGIDPDPDPSPLTGQPWGEVFQIATYKETTVNEIADRVKEHAQNETGQRVNVIHGKQRAGDVRRNYSDVSKAAKHLGYKPEFNLDEGLKYTFEYFRQSLNREKCRPDP